MKRTSSLLGSLLVVLLSVTSALAAKIDVDGVTVSYSIAGGMNAVYDDSDGTLTIAITQSGGNLTVTATPGAPAIWGGYVDVFLIANGMLLNTVNFKGRPDCRFYVTAQCENVRTIVTNYGDIGGTDAYGNRGWGTSSSDRIPNVKLKNSWTWGPVGSVDYSAPPAAGAEAKAIAASRKIKPAQ